MRALVRCVLAGLIVLAARAAPVQLALAANLDNIADHVLGQPTFLIRGDNQGGLSTSGISGSTGAAIDAHSGRLYVSDNGNSRVLSWPNAQVFSNGQAVDMALGQPNLTSGDTNNGGLSAASLSSPAGLVVDAQGNLFVADTSANRLLEYDRPLPLLRVLLPLMRH